MLAGINTLPKKNFRFSFQINQNVWGDFPIRSVHWNELRLGGFKNTFYHPVQYSIDSFKFDMFKPH